MIKNKEAELTRIPDGREQASSPETLAFNLTRTYAETGPAVSHLHSASSDTRVTLAAEEQLAPYLARFAMTEADLVMIAYVSSATRMLDEEEIREILRVSRKNNSAEELTGMLLYKDGNFMQVLEGPRERVQHRLDKIAKDPRHRGIIRLFSKDIHQRSFAEWSMAFRNLDPKSDLVDQVEGYSPFLATSLLDKEFQERPELCYKLLLSFKNNMR